MGMHPDSHVCAEGPWHALCVSLCSCIMTTHRIIHQLWCSPGQGHNQHEAEEVTSSDYSRLKKYIITNVHYLVHCSYTSTSYTDGTVTYIRSVFGHSVDFFTVVVSSTWVRPCTTYYNSKKIYRVPKHRSYVARTIYAQLKIIMNHNVTL